MVSQLSVDRIRAREILDSRGRPTVEVEVELVSGTRGMASVPAGASRGRFEAVERRDGESRYRGAGTQGAVMAIEREVGDALRGCNVGDQAAVDALLVELDGTGDRSRLGANAILAVSLACARAAAAATQTPVWRHLGGQRAHVLPLPMINLISGGLHADRALDIQDVLIVPVGAASFRHALEMSFAVREAAADILAARGLTRLKADEGGFAPPLPQNADALELTCAAIEAAGLRLLDEVAVALDVAASHFFDEESRLYRLQADDVALDAGGLVELLENWRSRFPIVSLEDPLADEDWPGWQAHVAPLTRSVQIVGDDLFVTRVDRVRRGVDDGVANAVLVKPNQVGTLSETLTVVEEARTAGFATIVSARSGETEDSFIADLAVGVSAGQIKIGSLAQSDRLAKYNQLLRIEGELGDDAVFAGRAALKP
jgi:enolase